MKTLIIAEKPSVARDLAKSLGKFESNKEYFENEQYIISWSLGHIVELYEPEDYNKKYKFWTLQSLPIIPEEFKFKPIKKTESRFKVLQKLIKREDVGTIVNACDAGREGELIFREIMLLTLNKGKKLKRLWLSAMTKEEIIKEFKGLKGESEFDNLSESAFARTEADWVVGINSTRAFTRRWGILLSLGRVQTPTLSIVCEREREIINFKPEEYFELEGVFLKGDYRYKGTYFNKKKETRFSDSKEIEKLVKKLQGKYGFIQKLQIKENKILPPLLYDLTELQRDSNKIYGFSAQKTLNIAQSLYESRKLITYPRTDSRYLPSSLKQNVKNVINKLKYTQYGSFVTQIIKKGVEFSPRIINDKAVTDHYAIIPTGDLSSLHSIRREEAQVFDLILKRFLSVFMDDALALKINFNTNVEGELFKTSISQIKIAGWMEIYGQSSQGDFIVIKENEKVKNEKIEVLKKQTQPPPRFTDATLLTAMENAGKLVEDEELREAMKEKGLGTPATRAAIIERLIEVGYLERVSKSLVPTDKGMRLIELASSVQVEEILSPTLTGEWEKKLIDIEKGKANSKEFMNGITELTTNIVNKVKNFSGEFSIHSGSGEPVGNCPKCGGNVFETIRGFTCENVEKGSCDFVIWKKLKNRTVSREIAEHLLKGETVEIEKMLSSYKKYYTARIKIEDGKVAFVFDNAPQEKINLEPLGECPLCKGNVFESNDSYYCESTDNKCRFRMKKVLGNRLISREEVKELLKNKRTALLEGFISKSGKSFSAYLYIDKYGAVRFEFEKKTRKKKIGNTRRGSKK